MFYYLMIFLAVIGIAANFALGKAYQLCMPATFGVVMRKTIPISLLSAFLFYCMGGKLAAATSFTLWMAALGALITVLVALVSFFGYASGSIATFTLCQMVGGMLLPFLYGIFDGNRLTVCKCIGMGLMLFSVAFPFLGGGKPAAGDEKEGKRASGGARFAFLCVAIFFLNGIFSIVSYIHSNSASAAPDATFLVIKSLMTAGLCLPLCLGYRLFTASGRQDRPLGGGAHVQALLVPALLILFMALADGLSYRLQLLSAAHLPAVALYPILTGGTTIATAIAGRVFFREKLSPKTITSLLAAFCATILFMF